MSLQPHRRTLRQSSTMLIVAILFLLAGADSAFADEIAVWNFNDSDLVVDHGTGTLASNFVVTNILFAAGTTNNARLGDLAGQAHLLQVADRAGGQAVTARLVARKLGLVHHDDFRAGLRRLPCGRRSRWPSTRDDQVISLCHNSRLIDGLSQR